MIQTDIQNASTYESRDLCLISSLCILWTVHSKVGPYQIFIE